MLCPSTSPSLSVCSIFHWPVPQFPCVTVVAPLPLPAFGGDGAVGRADSPCLPLLWSPWPGSAGLYQGSGAMAVLGCLNCVGCQGKGRSSCDPERQCKDGGMWGYYGEEGKGCRDEDMKR